MNKKTLQSVSLPVGMISLAIGIILNRYFPDNNATDFSIGFLFGLSIVLNIYYIYNVSKNLRKSEDL